jgi:hypothetical protein
MIERAAQTTNVHTAFGMEKAKLSDQENALYAKLFACCDDFGIARSCARYIRKKGWHTCAFLRRGSVPTQQIAFTTTMIVAYARPFKLGGGNIALPERLIRYRNDEKELHKRLLKLRNTEYAHSDKITYDVTPYTGSIIKVVANIRDVCFTEIEIDLFLFMTKCLLYRIKERMDQLRLGDYAQEDVGNNESI